MTKYYIAKHETRLKIGKIGRRGLGIESAEHRTRIVQIQFGRNGRSERGYDSEK